MTQPTAPQGEQTAAAAEQLWLRAHEWIRRGNLAQGVRDLAKSFEILKALKDPRVRQVHAKWVEVHKLYTEEQKAGAVRPVEREQPVATLQAEAEAAANAGKLDVAIALYGKIVAAQAQNELARERLVELQQAKQRADEMSGAAKPVVQHAAGWHQQPTTSSMQAPVAAQQPVVAKAQPLDPVAYLESLLVRVEQNKRRVA
jgi:hypothetical protein